MTEKLNNAAGTIYPSAADKDSWLNRRLIAFLLENSLYKWKSYTSAYIWSVKIISRA